MEQLRALDRALDRAQWPIAFIDVKRLYPDAKLPEYKTVGSVGADLCAYVPEDPIRDSWYPLIERPARSLVISPREAIAVGTGIAIQLPSGCHGMVKGRSGNARDRQLDAHVGTLDMDYTGEVHVLLFNHGQFTQVIEHGERIGQLVIVPTMRGLFGEVDELQPTVRGSQGFGSSGKF